MSSLTFGRVYDAFDGRFDVFHVDGEFLPHQKTFNADAITEKN